MADEMGRDNVLTFFALIPKCLLRTISRNSLYTCAKGGRDSRCKDYTQWKEKVDFLKRYVKHEECTTNNEKEARKKWAWQTVGVDAYWGKRKHSVLVARKVFTLFRFGQCKPIKPNDRLWSTPKKNWLQDVLNLIAGSDLFEEDTCIDLKDWLENDERLIESCPCEVEAVKLEEMRRSLNDLLKTNLNRILS